MDIPKNLKQILDSFFVQTASDEELLDDGGCREQDDSSASQAALDRVFENRKEADREAQEAASTLALIGRAR